MKITAIGVGSAFSGNGNFNQCYMVEENGRKLFIDMGQQIVPFALKNAGLSVKDIDDIYISHLHADHCGSLEAVAFLRYDWAGRTCHWSKRKPEAKAPRLFAKKAVMDQLWQETLQGGLKNSMQWFDATLDSFFETHPIVSHSFEWEGWECVPVQSVHIMSFSDITPSYGLIMKKEGHKTVYFTTDSQHCSPQQVEHFYSLADLIFQDGEFVGVNMLFSEGEKYYMENDKPRLFPKDDPMAIMEILASGKEEKIWGCAKFNSGVHANYAQLAGYPSANSIKLSKETKAKMFISHYPDLISENKDAFGNYVNWEEQIKKDGFAGLAKVGQTWTI